MQIEDILFLSNPNSFDRSYWLVSFSATSPSPIHNLVTLEQIKKRNIIAQPKKTQYSGTLNHRAAAPTELQPCTWVEGGRRLFSGRQRFVIPSQNKLIIKGITNLLYKP